MIFKDLVPSYGDILRIKLCGIYHFGIFVDDKTVVQFGLPPISTFARKNVKVLSTTLNDFSCGFPVQVAVFFGEELSRINSPEIRVKKALARLGEGGYNILHNNCEHFVRWCKNGKAYSGQVMNFFMDAVSVLTSIMLRSPAPLMARLAQRKLLFG